MKTFPITYSRQIMTRASLGFGLVIAVLTLITLAHWFGKNQTADEGGLFYPEERVRRILALHDTIQQLSTSPAGTTNTPVSSQLCNDRATLILGARLNDYAQNGSIEVPAVTGNLLRSSVVQRSTSCRELIQDIELLTDIQKSLPRQGAPITEADVRQRLAEVIEWKPTPFCMSIRKPQSSTQTVYLAGNLSQCLPKNVQLQSAAISDHTALLIRPLYRYMSRNLRDKGDVILNVTTTIHPFIVDRLAYLQQCKDGDVACGDLQNLLNKGSFSIVILNAENSEILGFKCLGARCENWRSQAGDVGVDWASLHMVSPPASTSKLFYAMGIARHGKVPEIEIERQIKTSGQIDGRSAKRNEWWERQSICDWGKVSANHDCPIARYANTMAAMFSWNRSCDTPGDIQCGRAPLIRTPLVTGFPAYIGVLGDGRSLGYAQTGYLRWDHYELIRQRKVAVKPSDRKHLESTSMAIQSVIGGGNSRVSAVGLAHAMAAFNQVADAKPLSTPFIIVNPDAPGTPPNQSPFPAARFDAVRRGLEKVMEPAEKSWPGDGTAHPAVVKAFGKECINGCGLAGKTGTVSAADPQNAGTTLFMGSAKMQKVAERFNLAFKGPFNTLAIGVIALPDQQRPSGSEHLASHVAMQTIRALFN